LGPLNLGFFLGLRTIFSQVSNIIFVDSPVGTGFSYAKTKEGLKTGDTKAVKQLLIFLRKVIRAFCTNENAAFCMFALRSILVVLQWLHDHPRFLSNPLYIAGDSYSGRIIPALTLEIHRSKLSSVHQGSLFYLGAHLMMYNEWLLPLPLYIEGTL